METAEGIVARIGFIAVLVFFIFANLSFAFYQYAKYQSKKDPDSPFKNLKIFFTLFVSSLMGMLFFMLVTIFVYTYLKMPGHQGKNKRSSSEPAIKPAVSPINK